MKRTAFYLGRKLGKETVNYIDIIMTRLATLRSHFLLAIVADPTLAMKFWASSRAFAYFSTDTSLLRDYRGVVLTLEADRESYLMRHYDGLADDEDRPY